ncbi:MAG: DegT/DnrJ/EryC1/StrS family aminotransferase [Lachnospiraceae bacterium]|nr:DegT/DnrJ/EryC1/StrS family aminotransferase [Lachnospiraceae bacterium]
MEKRKIIFSPPDITEEEIEEVAEALRSGWITTGPRTKELERQIAEYVHTSKAVALNSATAAEELNFVIAGIGEGDEVIVPAYTYTASASAAIHVGATVRFVDVQSDSLEPDYDALEAMINEKTKAIVPVDIAGIPCDYDRIFDIVEKKRSLFTPGGNTDLGRRIQKAIGRVLVIADGAHAFGASRAGRMVGEIADFTSFSFHAVKNFTTAEGGAAVWRDIPGVDNEEIYKQYQLYSLHGQSKDALAKTKLGAWEYDIIGPWYKCNMTDVSAAIGLVQMKRYAGLLKRRREIIEMYDQALSEIEDVKRLTHYTDRYTSSGHLYLTRISSFDDAKRREFISKMEEKGVPCNVHYKPLPMMTGYKALGFDIKDFPNAYHMFENEVTIPLHTKLSDEDVNFIAQTYIEVYKEMK